jgi:hypothetical protein
VVLRQLRYLCEPLSGGDQHVLGRHGPVRAGCRSRGKPSEPDIHRFEELFLKSVRQYGRVRELKTVMQFNLKTRRPFKDAGKGMQLMLKGAVSPWEMVKGGKKNPAVERIFARLDQLRHGESSDEG